MQNRTKYVILLPLRYPIIYYEEINMEFSYKKLWKLLIDREMQKKELCALAGISTATISKMTKGENVTTDTLIKICTALQCDITDILELVETKAETK